MIEDARAAETAAGLEPVAVSLGSETIHVLPVPKWRASGLRAMRDGDFETWAAKCLTEDSFDTWLDVDPTIEEIEAMFVAWSELSGQTPEKSSASRRSSKRTGTRSNRISRRTTA